MKLILKTFLFPFHRCIFCKLYCGMGLWHLNHLKTQTDHELSSSKVNIRRSFFKLLLKVTFMFTASIQSEAMMTQSDFQWWSEQISSYATKINDVCPWCTLTWHKSCSLTNTIEQGDQGGGQPKIRRGSTKNEHRIENDKLIWYFFWRFVCRNRDVSLTKKCVEIKYKI